MPANTKLATTRRHQAHSKVEVASTQDDIKRNARAAGVLLAQAMTALQTIYHEADRSRAMVTDYWPSA